MLHNGLIAAHVACAVLAFALGLVAICQPRARISGVFRTYLGALWLMVPFLILVVLLDWPGLDPVTRLVFSGLVVLGVFTGWRGWRAAQDQSPGAYVDDVGFTLIALFDGFVLVSSIDLGAPVWLVAALGVVGVLLGRLGLQRLKELKERATPPPVVTDAARP